MNSLPYAAPAVVTGFCPTRLEAVFSRCFFSRYRTRLVGGFDEPLYLPSTQVNGVHELRYREDFFASALHEVAHWCIAGATRRAQVDFGYWYAPDGRTEAQQRAFEQVEVVPQTLEWMFARACGYPFRPSADNLASGQSFPREFALRLVHQAQEMSHQGLAERANEFFTALRAEFGTAEQLEELTFSLSQLQPPSCP